MSANSQAAQIDDGTHSLTTEETALQPEARVRTTVPRHAIDSIEAWLTLFASGWERRLAEVS